MRAQFADILPCADAEDLVDFTCSTPWERLVLDVELQLRDWKLDSETIHSSSIDASTPPVSPTRGAVPPRHESHAATPVSVVVSLASREFSLNYHARPDGDLSSILGVGRCVVLGPRDVQSVAAVDASDAASLLSALTAAAAAAGCFLPMIVRVGPADALRLLGRQGGPHPKRFCCDNTSYPPTAHSHLPGILQLFHNKRVTARRMLPPARNDAIVSAHYTYYWSDFSFKLTAALDSFANDPVLSPIHRKALAMADPVPYLILTVIWAPFHGMDVESSSATASSTSPSLAGPTSSMSPRTASIFRLSPPGGVFSFSMAPTNISSLPLTSSVTSCLRLTHKATMMRTGVRPAAARPLVDIHAAAANAAATVAGSADGFEDVPRLSDSQSAPVLRNHGGSAHYRFGSPLGPRRNTAWREYQRNNQGPWSMSRPPDGAMDNFVAQTRQYVAAAAVADDNFDEDYMNCAVALLFALDTEGGIVAEVVDALGPGIAEMTAAERLAALASWNNSVKMTQRLWGLFLDGVELHWEMGWPIRGVPFEQGMGPSTADCLLVQKLEMLNCCMHRLHNKNLFGADGEGDHALGRKKKLWQLSPAHIPKSTPSKGVADDARTLEDGPVTEDSMVGGYIWEPHVQPMAYVTRDMAEAEQEKIVKLSESSGPCSQDTNVRRQASALRSDMMSFKAANPGASMADFVRWFSPADWVGQCGETEKSDDSARPASAEKKMETENKDGGPETDGSDSNFARSERGDGLIFQASHSSGRLSTRMSKPGNIWKEIWDSVKPVPASKQKPLFDAHLHGLKALSDLRALPMKEVARQLACVQAMYSVRVLQRAFERPPVIASVAAAIATARQCCVDCQQITPDGDAESLAMIGNACDKLAVAEHMALGAQSLISKVPDGEDCFQVINALVSGEDIDISAERYRRALSLVAGMDEGGWRTPLIPSYREFVLEGSDSDRMNVKLSSEMFRVGMRWNITYGSMG